MIRATRREALGGMLAGGIVVPKIGALASSRWTGSTSSLLVHDPSLEAGRRFAAAGEARGVEVQAIEGDRIRFARTLLERRPALIAGVSRHADALLIEDVAREAGYRRAAVIQGRGRTCIGGDCASDWAALGRMAKAADSNWVEALADYAAKPGEPGSVVTGAPARVNPDKGLVLGWVLVPRA